MPVSARHALVPLLCAALVASSAAPARAGSVSLSGGDDFELLKTVQKHVKRDFYMKDVKDDKLLTGAIRGMLAALDDPYTRYMEPQPFNQMQTDQGGEFEGVGIVITIKDRMLTVVSPIDDTPAARAGIRSGDRVVKIDGVETGKLTMQEAVDKIRGKKGTTVILTIWNESLPEPRDVSVVREMIPVVTVKSRMVDEKVGYLRLSQFVEPTGADLEKALHALGKQGAKSLILDLRDNPGGLLQSAVEVSRKFLGKNPVVSVRSRDGKTVTLSSYFRAHPHLPLVVLQNSGSASSSEIVGGAVQDNKRGILLGGKSFGKGVIQTVFTLPNQGGLILTTAWYFTPSGRSIHEKGIEPDLVLDQPRLTSDQQTDLYDPKSSFAKKESDVEEEPLDPETRRLAEKFGVKPYDRQLVRAIRLLNGSAQPLAVVYDRNVYPEAAPAQTAQAPSAKETAPAKK